MDYSFDMVEKLFKENIIVQDKNSGKYYVYNKTSKMYYDFEGEYANFVKFAHTWEYATEYGRSKPYVNEAQQESDIEYAFSDTARNTYNEIMKANLASIIMQGRLFSQDELIQALNARDPYKKDMKSIIEGLYEKQKGLESFNYWCLKATGKYYEENSSIGRLK